jgi:hypothetical protein
MGTRRWTIAGALAIALAGGGDAWAQDPVKELARAGHEKKLAGLTLIIGGSALVVAGAGMAIAGFEVDDRTRCHSSGFYYYSAGRDAYGAHVDGVSCENEALVVAGGTTWLVGAAALGIGIPVYVIGARQLRDATRLRRWQAMPATPPTFAPAPPGFTPAPPPFAPPPFAPPPFAPPLPPPPAP